MNAVSSARTVQLLGAGVFILGAILMGVGTTSIALFVFYVALAMGGVLLFGVGKKMYEKTLG